MAEVLKAPIEIVIEDSVDETSGTNGGTPTALKGICGKCNEESICNGSEKGNLTPDHFETPEPLTSDLEKTVCAEIAENVKFWSPEDEKRVLAKIGSETTEGNVMEEKVPEKSVGVECKESKTSEWSDCSLENSTHEDIKEDNFEDNNNNNNQAQYFESFDPPIQETQVRVIEEPKPIKTTFIFNGEFYSKNIPLEAINKAIYDPIKQVQYFESFDPPIQETQIHVVEEPKPIKKTVISNGFSPKNISSLSDDLKQTLTITEQIVEEPNDFVRSDRGNTPTPTPFKKDHSKGFHQSINALSAFRKPKPSYLDLDRPSHEEESSYDAVHWKSNSPTAHSIKRVNDFIINAEVEKLEREKSLETKKNLEMEQNLEASQIKIRSRKRNIPMPRPLRLGSS